MERTISRVQTPRQVAKPQQLRVAAYCRVSTDLEEQQSSLRAQMDVFERRIREHSGWTLVDIYADEGLSATSTKKRKEFLRLMSDAEHGRVDYIITKSLSRFARNTLDCLTWVRKLKEWGVNILFEKENIDTGSATSEIILTVMSAFAQEESHSISENLKWGLRKGFQQGKVRWRDIYGYQKNENGEWVPEPKEAEVIRRIFRLYEHGSSAPEIAEILNREKIPTLNGKQWRATGILPILANERYVGDVCTQKYVTTDFLTHKQMPNTDGVTPSYYIRNHHQPIVSRKTFERVAAIRSMRNSSNGSMQYPYGAIKLICPHCGKQLVQRSIRTGGAKLAWGCFTDEGCREYALKTWQLDAAVLEASAKLKVDKVEYWWLDEYIERIEPKDDRVIIHWKDGTTSEGKIPIKAWQHKPAKIAEDYRNYLEKAEENRHAGTQD